jgi:P4 family phage/plasmid primase-like protien
MPHCQRPDKPTTPETQTSGQDGTRTADTPTEVTPALVAGWLRLFFAPGDVAELRALGVKRGSGRPHTEAGFYDHGHLQDMAAAALKLESAAKGVYFTFNPLKTAILSRRANRVDYAEDQATDKDVLVRKWFLVDADPVREVAHISATDEEKKAAWDTVNAVRNYLAGEDWPDPIMADSGNGYHLLYPIDLPADDEEVVRRCLEALASQFDTDQVTIDRAVFNPARITKLYGTLARKGDHTEERPHRRSGILHIPEGLGMPAPPEKLQALAAEAPQPEPPKKPAKANGANNGQFEHRLDVPRWLAHYGQVFRQKPKPDNKGRTVYVLASCPFDPAHADPDSCVMQGGDGKLSAQCFHSSCSGRGWQEFRQAIGEPLREHWDPPKQPRQQGAADGRQTPGPEPSANGTGHMDDDGPHLTDQGNARRVVQAHGADLRHCHPWRSWYVWDGTRWRPDDTAEAVRRVKQTQAAFYLQAAKDLVGTEGDERKKRRATLDHALMWEDARRIANCLDLMRSEPGIPVVPADLDADPFLLNVANGTLDLRTGELRPHRREDLITKLAPVEYHPGAGCPLWLKVLSRVMGGNDLLITYLQRLVGYALTGDVSEQVLWFLYGAGQNGKSTFLMTILAMLGDYAMQAVSDLLMQKRNESHPTERADLFGRRFVATIETEEGKRLAEALMKQLTGGDKVRARKMRQDFFEFSPTHKIVLAANHKPVIRGCDMAVWRRIKLVPFLVTIPEKEKDKNLPGKLLAELPGILAWAVRGCLDWQRHGLGEPEAVRDATDEYRAEQDVLARFFEEVCVTIPEARVKSSALLEAYQRWSGDKWMTSVEFSKRLTARGFASKKSGGVMWWHGIGLPQEEESSF